MTNMSEIENKFIMMSRIAVLMSRIGLTSTVYISNTGCHCSLDVLIDNEVVESLNSWIAQKKSY